jgi:hypothetical protein
MLLTVSLLLEMPMYMAPLINTGILMISHPFIIVLLFLLIICSLPVVSSLHMLQKVMAQTNTTTVPSMEGEKVLVDDAIQALKNNDSNKAVIHLNILNQQLSVLGNSSSVQSVKVLVDDTNEALKNGDINKAILHLNLINQQLATPSSGNAISSNAALGSATTPTVIAPPLGKAVTAEPRGGTNGTNNTYDLNIDGKSYPLIYQITGTGNKLNNIRTEACAFGSCPRNKLNNVERDNTTLLVNIVAQSNGKLTIELPRSLIDSKEHSNIDKPYLVWEDGLPPALLNNTVEEVCTKNNAQVRTLAVDFDKGSKQIEIVGSVGPLGTTNKSQANQSPIASDDSFTTENGNPITIMLKGRDPDCDPILFSIKSKPYNGELTGFDQTTGKAIYTPNSQTGGVDSFTFQVTDSHNNTSNIAYITLVPNKNTAQSQITSSEQWNTPSTTPEQPHESPFIPPSQTEQGSNPSITPLVPSRPSEQSQGNGIDWMGMCNKVQLALYQSCDTLVNSSDGSLTSEGERAFGCIRNGALLALGALGLGLPPGVIIGGLGLLAAPTGCDSIVKMDQLGSIGDLSSLSKTLSNALGLGR